MALQLVTVPNLHVMIMYWKYLNAVFINQGHPQGEGACKIQPNSHTIPGRSGKTQMPDNTRFRNRPRG